MEREVLADVLDKDITYNEYRSTEHPRPISRPDVKTANGVSYNELGCEKVRDGPSTHSYRSIHVNAYRNMHIVTYHIDH